ncbi:hypothetical protein HPB50_020339 [Hyalomma asiaticum]|uniref:Uncharacterized protein n=1 Tax=Hyalomma asiaticum TaxID=266040 RepID=A0ACB7SK04_HYAAI|nr:hypothetical protein HPB50_020339 [Hyalomma asiaticum]
MDACLGSASMEDETEKWHLTVENVKAICKEESDKATVERRALLAELAEERVMRVALKTQLDELQQALQNRDTTASRCDPSPRLEAENARSAHNDVVVPPTVEGLGNSICSIDQNESPATDTPKRKDEESDSRTSENGPGRTLPLNTKKRNKTRPKLTSPALSQNAESSQMSPNAVPDEAKDELAMFTKFCDNGGLLYPSEKPFSYVDALEITFTMSFSYNELHSDSLEELFSCMQKNDCTLGCAQHGLSLTKQLTKFFLLTRLHFYTKALNKERASSREKKKHLKLRRVT